MTDTMTPQNIDLSSWDTLYFLSAAFVVWKYKCQNTWCPTSILLSCFVVLMYLNTDGENHSQEADSPSTSQQIP